MHFLADYRISKAEGEIDPPRDRLPDLLFEPTTRDSQLWLLRVVGQGVGFAYSEATFQAVSEFWEVDRVSTRVVGLDPKPGVAGVAPGSLFFFGPVVIFHYKLIISLCVIKISYKMKDPRVRIHEANCEPSGTVLAQCPEFLSLFSEYFYISLLVGDFDRPQH